MYTLKEILRYSVTLSILTLLSPSIKAEVIYKITWGNINVGTTTAKAIMVIDETVCLDAGTCPTSFVPASSLGITLFDFTITGGCRDGETLDLHDFQGFKIVLDKPFNPNADLLAIASDININAQPFLDPVSIYKFQVICDSGAEDLSVFYAEPIPNVPTLSSWALIILCLILVIFGSAFLWSRKSVIIG